MTARDLRILALDLATVTGYAYRLRGDIVAGTKSFDPGKKEKAWRPIFLRTWLEVVFERLQPDHVAYELPFVKGKGSKALFGLETVLKMECATRGIRYWGVVNTTVKAFATKHGDAGKVDMVRAAERKWPALAPIVSDDQADAMWILAWAEQHIPETLEKEEAAVRAKKVRRKTKGRRSR